MATTTDQLVQWLRKATPQIEFEHVEVTFPATANQDLIIPTILRPANPEHIHFRVVDMKFVSAPATTPCIYRDDATTRRTWQPGSIVLRCNVASVRCTLELFVKRDI